MVSTDIESIGRDRQRGAEGVNFRRVLEAIALRYSLAIIHFKASQRARYYSTNYLNFEPFYDNAERGDGFLKNR